MQAAPIPAPVQAFAPDFAARFGRILAGLAKLVAAGFLRNPRLVLLIIPFWNRLNRAARRCERLMAHVAAGHLPRPHKPGPGGPRPGGPALPTGRGWLARELGSEGACHASQMQALLAEPAAVELLLHAPTAGRIVNPILRMLGIGPFTPRQRPVRPAPAPAPPPPPVAVPPPAPARPRALPPPGDDAPRSSGFPWHVLLGVPEKPA